MRVISRIMVSGHERTNSVVPLEYVKQELATKAAQKLVEFPIFFTEVELPKFSPLDEGNPMEHRMEFLVYDTNSLKAILHKFQDKLKISDQVMKELWHTLMNEI